MMTADGDALNTAFESHESSFQVITLHHETFFHPIRNRPLMYCCSLRSDSLQGSPRRFALAARAVAEIEEYDCLLVE